MPVRLLIEDKARKNFKLQPGETTFSLAQKVMQAWGTNFTYTLQETNTGRFLPDDEVLLDNREYYLTFRLG